MRASAEEAHLALALAASKSAFVGVSELGMSWLFKASAFQAAEPAQICHIDHIDH